MAKRTDLTTYAYRKQRARLLAESDHPHSSTPRAAVRRPAGGVVRRRGHILCERCATDPPSFMSHHAGATNSDDDQGET
ncbi:hypothetical protein [Streptomyces sp. NPDC001502]|uniref:hypothetical protein n=1 Tax=Streptomyces sp. NPDC001502 TaxID=3364578 RepID=UPI0036892B15